MSTWEQGEAQTHTKTHEHLFCVRRRGELGFNAELRGGQQTADSLRSVLLKPKDGEARQFQHKRHKALFVAVRMTSSWRL